MALSRKKAAAVSYLASLMALASSEAERLELLTKVLNCLAIDEQARAEGLHDAQQRTRSKRPAPKSTTVDTMGADELRSHIDGLYAQRAALLNERQAPAPVDEAPAQPVTTPASKLPTKQMRKRLATFDGLSDGDQLAWLRDSLGL